MDKLRFGVVGVRGMGFGHLKTITASEVAELVAICDVDVDIAKERRAEVESDATIYQDFETMLKEAEIDAVTLATPHYLHSIHAIAAAEAGKHVLTEKPLAVSVGEADAMIDAAKRNNVVLGVGHQRRWSGAIRGLRRTIRDGSLGAPLRFSYSKAGVRHEGYYASGEWRGTWAQEGGGMLINQFVHDLDALCYLLGNPVEVVAMSRNWGHKHEVDDVVMAVVAFDSGWTGTLNLSLCSAGGWGSAPDIFEGDEAVINGGKIARRSMPARTFIAESPGTKPELGEFEDIAPEEMDKEGRDKYYEDFLKAVNGEIEFEGSGEACRWAVELDNAIFLSTLTGKKVSIPLDRDEVAGMFKKLSAGAKTFPRVR